MADVPSEAPHKLAGKGLAGLKNLPKWAIPVFVGGFVILVLYMRHRSAAASAASGQDPSTTPGSTDPNSPNYDPNADPNDPSNYGADTNGTDAAYTAGYDSGLYSNDSGLPTDIYGGAGSSGAGSYASPVGPGVATDTSTGLAADPTSTPAAVPGGALTVSTTNNFPTVGGGAPSRHAVHGVTSKPAKPKPKAPASIKAPSGPHKPKPKKGYKVVGTGHGNWKYVKVH